MSEISTRIREYVNDPTVSDHYGEWGALRADQRRQIRELCDTCDMYEKAADSIAAEIFAEFDKAIAKCESWDHIPAVLLGLLGELKQKHKEGQKKK